MTDASHTVATIDELKRWEQCHGRGVPPKFVPPQREPTRAERRAALKQRLDDELSFSARLLDQLAYVDRVLLKCADENARRSIERIRAHEQIKIEDSIALAKMFSEALDKFDADVRAEAARFIASSPK